jgi:hypothetical protein
MKFLPFPQHEIFSIENLSQMDSKNSMRFDYSIRKKYNRLTEISLIGENSSEITLLSFFFVILSIMDNISIISEEGGLNISLRM